LDRSACLIVLSSQWANLLKGITSNKKINIIPNFVSVSDMRKLQKREEFTLLFLGHLRHVKGLFDLVEAVATLTADFPLLRIEVCGDEDESPLVAMASRLDILGRIKINGWVSGNAKDELMRSATLFVLPSYYEGLPMGVLEAMANDLPVITTDVGGIPDIITSDRNGILVKPGDVKGLAAAIRVLLMQPEKRKELADAARLTVINYFSASVVIPKIGSLYASFGVLPKKYN
jgi:glycosyltransferase involved in cell wall biosynthesis